MLYGFLKMLENYDVVRTKKSIPSKGVNSGPKGIVLLDYRSQKFTKSL